MPNFENLRKQAKQLVRWHRERNYSVGGRIRAALPSYRDSADADLLAMRFTLAMAQEVIAKESGFESWAALKSGVDHMPTREQPEQHDPFLRAAAPQLFVSDIRAACDYYTNVLGFDVVFVHGKPPFYGQVARDGIRLNLRLVDAPVIDAERREHESLLSAYVDVSGVKELFNQFKSAGADIQQPLRRQPWGTQEFVLRDPDGSLLCFAESSG